MLHRSSSTLRRLFAPAASIAHGPPDTDSNAHLELAASYMEGIRRGRPAENTYGGQYATDNPPFLFKDGGPCPHTYSRTRCGSLLALLFKQAYPALAAASAGVDALQRLTAMVDPEGRGATLPSASLWHDAIEQRVSCELAGEWMRGKYHFVRRHKVRHIEPGDVLASKYDRSNSEIADDATGHVMLVKRIQRVFISLGAPRVSGTDQYLVTVIDSTSRVHGPNDTRNPDRKGNSGLGEGVIVLYGDAISDTIYGWTWKVDPNPRTNPVWTQRHWHIVAGRLFCSAV